MKAALLKMADAKTLVENVINQNKVAVFSKTGCPFCKKAIDALNAFKPKEMHVEQIEKNPLCDQIQDLLKEKTGARSVPRVFIGGGFFGGGDETAAALKDGKLEAALKEAGAISQ